MNQNYYIGMTVVFKLYAMTVCTLHRGPCETVKPCLWTENQSVYGYSYRVCYISISENKLEKICLKFSRFLESVSLIFLQKMFTLSRQNCLCPVCVDCCPWCERVVCGGRENKAFSGLDGGPSRLELANKLYKIGNLTNIFENISSKHNGFFSERQKRQNNRTTFQ